MGAWGVQAHPTGRGWPKAPLGTTTTPLAPGAPQSHGCSVGTHTLWDPPHTAPRALRSRMTADGAGDNFISLADEALLSPQAPHQQSTSPYRAQHHPLAQRAPGANIPILQGALTSAIFLPPRSRQSSRQVCLLMTLLTINNSNNLLFQQTWLPETPQVPFAAGWLHADIHLHRQALLRRGCFIGPLSM